MTPREAALYYHKLGANVTAIEAGQKGPAHRWDQWQAARQQRAEVQSLPWQGYTVRRDGKRHKAGDEVTIGGVGIISGINGWRVFDVDARKGEDKRPIAPVSDATVDRLLSALGLPASYPWVWRSGSGAGWEVAVRCEERMPEGALTPDKREKGVFTGWPAEGEDWHHLELRWESCQTVCPPSADGRGYAWRGETPTETPALLPVRRIIAAFYDLCPPHPHTLGSVDRAVVEAIKQRFDLVAYAEKAFGGESVGEGREVRILGHQGLLIDPEKGIWYIFGEQVGGDCFDLVAFSKYQTTARNLNGKSAEILAETAAYAGVAVPEPERPSIARVDTSTGEILDPRPASWIERGVTLAELQRRHFEPLRWIIEDICPEGVTLIAAKPKAKKSWMALGISLAVSMAQQALGRLAVDSGRVLYLDLEGNQRRIKSRARAILGNAAQPWPSNFHVFTEWPKGDDCVAQIEHWLLAYPDTKMVVIDLLAEIRPPMDPRADRYQYDRDLLVTLNKLAEKHHVAIVVIHHTRKAKGEDVFDEVSGTLGINGAVATLWIMSRHPEGHVILSMTGRDLVKDEPLALTWDAYLCSFVIEGNAAEIALSAERRAILELMADDRPWSPKEIAMGLSKSVGSVQQLLRDMIQEGTVDKAGYGKYARIPGKSDQSGKSGASGKSGNSYRSGPTLTDSYQGVVRVPEASGSPKVPENDNSYHSYHDSYTYSHHRGLWQVWNPGRTSVVTVCGSEAEARAECERLNGGAS